MDDKLNDVLLFEKERRLSISRVPKKTKELFIQIANENFAGDYGLFLKNILDQAIEYKGMKTVFFENINNKLDYIISKVNKVEEPTNEEDTGEIRMLSGKIIKKGKEVKK